MLAHPFRSQNIPFPSRRHISADWVASGAATYTECHDKTLEPASRWERRELRRYSPVFSAVWESWLSRQHFEQVAYTSKLLSFRLLCGSEFLSNLSFFGLVHHFVLPSFSLPFLNRVSQFPTQ